MPIVWADCISDVALLAFANFSRSVGRNGNPTAATPTAWSTWANTVDPADFDKFIGQVGCLCTRYGLSPPFQLRALAAAWVALDIPLAHCLDTIGAYLTAHAAKCYSGASDRLFQWVDIFLRSPAPSSRPAHTNIGTIKRVERVREEDWQGEY
jgi:hypothetical protein